MLTRLTLTVKLLAVALTALAQRATESASFTVTARNGQGTSRVSARIVKLVGSRSRR